MVPSPTPPPSRQPSRSLLRLADRPLPASRDVFPRAPRPGLGCEVADPVWSGGSAAGKKYTEPQGLRRRRHGGAGEGAGTAQRGAGCERVPGAAPAPPGPEGCRGRGAGSSRTEEGLGVPAEPAGGGHCSSQGVPGRAGLSSHPVGLTRVLALPFLFRFSELDP